MVLIDDIQKVKIGRFELLSASITTSGGQKNAIHEFVNTTKTSVEDLGERLEKFTVSGEITGNNYTSDVRLLRNELTVGGVKSFVHKTLGTFQVKVLNYTLIENEKNFGIAEFSINLQRINTDIIAPVPSSPDQPTISKNRQTVHSTAAAAVETQTTVLPGQKSKNASVAKLTQFADRAQQIATDFQSVASSVDTSVSSISTRIDQFARSINLIKGSAFAIIESPLAIARSVQDVFSSLDALIDVPEEAFAAYKSLFRFGDDDIVQPNDTLDYIARNQNINVLNNQINVNALASAYDRSAEIDYQTVDDIEAVQADLEGQYSYSSAQLDLQADQSILLTRASGSIFRSESEETAIINGQTLESASGDSEFDNTDDLMVVIDIIRSNSRLFFNDKKLSTPQIITINTPAAPAAVISYLIYGSTEFAEDLIELNKTNDTIIFGGRGLKVISA